MTVVEAVCTRKSRVSGWFRSRRLLSFGAAVAAIALAAVAVSRHYGFPSSASKFNAAFVAMDHGDLSLARQYARELRASQQHPEQAALLRGALLLEKGFCYPALDELAKAKRDPALENAALTLEGQAWYRLGRHVEAQAALKQVLKREPDSVEAHRWLAASYYDLGAIQHAVHYLTRTAELDPADPRPHSLLGLIYKDYEQYESAVLAYQESLRRKSDQQNATEMWQDLAACQVKLRRYQAALATLKKCSELPESDVLRSECQHALGQSAQAKETLAKALAQQPDNLDGLLLQGTLLLEEGDAAQAVNTLKHAAELHPKNYMAHFRLAQAYANAGEEELSKSEQDAAEKIRVLRHEFAELHQAAWTRPRDVEVRLRLATLARELDMPELANVWLRSAAALQPLTGAGSN